jgi:FKBP-type peptidyl-prolyl cis-trans isomerase
MVTKLAWAVLLGGLFLCPEIALSDDAKGAEIPLPTLPDKASKADEDAPKTFTTSPSGLKYRVLRKGKGAKPTADDRVTVHYHGWLDGGKVFDSSYNRGKETSFPLNMVIKGWTEGMQYVGEGGMIELEIPFNIAYGERGRPPQIPPRATLHFVVELLKVQ